MGAPGSRCQGDGRWAEEAAGGQADGNRSERYFGSKITAGEEREVQGLLGYGS